MTMSHRQLIALRELKEMREAEAREAREREEAKRAERERPIREAEEAYKTAHQELGKLTREKILTGLDDEGYLDPETRGMRMSLAEGKAFNAREIAAFREENPDAYWSQHNVDAIGDYFSRNGVQLVSRKTLAAAWERLNSYGCLESAPEPAPVPEPKPEPQTTPQPEPVPETFEGWDPDTGERRAYTRWDVDRMSSEQYRRAFRVYKQALRLPTRPAF